MNLAKLKRVPAKLLSIAYAWNDYRLYAQSIKGYRRLAETMQIDPAKGSLLIVSGRGMNVLLAQIWTLFSLAVRANGLRAAVLTTRNQGGLNRYFELLDIELIYLEDWVNNSTHPASADVENAIETAVSFEEFRSIHYKKAPIGQIALSTFSRHHGTGMIDLGKPEVRAYVVEWVRRISNGIDVSERLFDRFNVKLLFFTEVFMEEYGAVYYAALNRALNITRFAGTVRDDAIICQHLTVDNDRIHHSSLSQSSWEKIKQLPYSGQIDAALHQNFMDRYGHRWSRSRRNHPNTQILSPHEARAQLGIAPDRKVAVIFSHILYDTLFFFGTDLFKDYSEWLIETVKVACSNPNVDWLIKVHPSNLWRGELGSLLKGKYEEERIIEQAIGKLPPHVRIVQANTKINPYTWFQLADYGITVRGTSGLEMAALGKCVITAGTGRYEGNGFTLDPGTADEYREMLRQLPAIPSLSPEQTELAKRYAYAIFMLKPFTMTSLRPRLRTGIREMRASDDLIQCCRVFEEDKLPPDLERFSAWVADATNLDLLDEWTPHGSSSR